MTGISFQDLRDVRCPKCTRLLFRVRGVAEIEAVCSRCKSKVVWPDLNCSLIVTEAVTERVLATKQIATSAAAITPIMGFNTNLITDATKPYESAS